MSSFNVFSPGGATVKVTANNTPIAVNGVIGTGIGNTLRVVNTGTILVYVKLNGNTATATDIPMLPGTVETFMFGGTAVSVLSSTTTSADIYFTQGEGA